MESYERKITRWLLVAALVAGGGCASEVVDCSEGGEDERSVECMTIAEASAVTPVEKPKECLAEALGNLCQQPDRDCWPKRENGCASGVPGYLCGYPAEPPKHCDVFFVEIGPNGQNPIWCCF